MLSNNDRAMCASEFLYSALIFLSLLFLGCSSSREAEHLAPILHDFSDIPQVHAEPVLFSEGFSAISDIYSGYGDYIYVADAGRHHVIRLDNQGGRVDSIGGRGSQTTQFDQPRYIDATNDLKIFVSDYGNRRVSMFDRRFQYLGHVSLTSSSNREIRYTPGPVASNARGEIFFWDENARRLMKLGSNNQLDDFFTADVSEIRYDVVAIANSGNEVLLAESQTGRIFRFSESGRYIGYFSGFGNVLDITLSENQLYILTNESVFELNMGGMVLTQINWDATHPVLRISSVKERIYIATSTELFWIIR